MELNNLTWTSLQSKQYSTTARKTHLKSGNFILDQQYLYLSILSVHLNPLHAYTFLVCVCAWLLEGILIVRKKETYGDLLQLHGCVDLRIWLKNVDIGAYAQVTVLQY